MFRAVTVFVAALLLQKGQNVIFKDNFKERSSLIKKLIQFLRLKNKHICN